MLYNSEIVLLINFVYYEYIINLWLAAIFYSIYCIQKIIYWNFVVFYQFLFVV